jgi:gliding motility-associated transport system permease protein
VRVVWLVLCRELGAYFRSYMGTIVLAVVLLVDGLLFNVYALGGGSKYSAEVLRQFFYFSSGTTMIASIFLTMRLLAEERQMGTMVLYTTSPVGDGHVVLGKFLSAFVFLCLLTFLTLYMPLLIFVTGKVSAGHILGGYVGLLSLGAASLAIGMFGSSLAQSQIVAAIVSAAILVTMLLFWLLANITDPPLSDIFSYLALHNKHFFPFMKGTVNTRDLIYYLTVTWFFLMASTKVLEARRWR